MVKVMVKKCRVVESNPTSTEREKRVLAAPSGKNEPMISPKSPPRIAPKSRATVKSQASGFLICLLGRNYSYLFNPLRHRPWPGRQPGKAGHHRKENPGPVGP